MIFVPSLKKGDIKKLKPYTQYCTDNYGLFSFPVGNRPINENRVKRMVKNFKERYVSTESVKINVKGEILDGQHFFRACCETKPKRRVPFVYDPRATMEDIQVVSKCRSAWTALDFAYRYAALGNVEYQALLKFREDWKIPLGLAQVLLSRSVSYDYAVLRNEEFKCTDYTWGTEVMQELMSLEDIVPDKRVLRNERFLLALARALGYFDFELPQFIAKVKLNARHLVRCATTIQYLDMIKDIYNYRRMVGKVNFS